MKNIYLILIFSTIFSSQTVSASGGFYVGNGGDVIHCAKTHRFGTTKPYALDYFLAHLDMNDDFSIQSVNSFSTSINRIEVGISVKLPFLLKSFQEYSELILNTDPSKKYHWLKASDLNNIEDEGEGIYPGNCWDEYNSMGRIDQAIIRQVVSDKEKKVKFIYDNRLLSKLKAASSLQYSFLLIHEWLRNFTNNPETIGKANYYIHSKEFLIDSPAEVRTRLQNFNLHLVQ